MSHQCPAAGCPQKVADHLLMCRPHWYKVPRDLRNAVWAAWRNGAGAGTPEHRRAIADAIAAVNWQMKAKP